MSARARSDVRALVRYVERSGGRCPREDLLDIVLDELAGWPEDLGPLLIEAADLGLLEVDLCHVSLPREP